MENKKTDSIEELIKEEQRSRKMALALERKSEHWRNKADIYLEMLRDIGASDE